MPVNNAPLVVSIIVHYQAIEECIQIIKDLQSIDYSNHYCIVVDNPSTDEVYSELKHKISFPGVHLIRNKVNNGYGGGINYGVEYAKSLNPTYYQIINTDTRIVSISYISKLVSCFEQDSNIGLIGPGVTNSLGDVQNTIMSFPSLYNAIFFKKRHNRRSTIESPANLYSVEVINGVCLMIRAEAFNAIGGFDEDFFMYGEEHDLCFRLTKANYTCHYLSENAIIHQESHKSQDGAFTWRQALVRINQVLYLKKRKRRIEANVLAFLFSLSITIKKLTRISFSDISFFAVVKGLFNPNKFNQFIMDKSTK